VIVDATVLKGFPLPEPNATTNKHQRGCLGIVGGSRETPGGVLLAGVAALRSGAGRVEIATAESVAAVLGVAFPEARVIAVEETRSGALSPRDAADAVTQMRCETLLLGTGAFDPEVTGELLRQVLPKIDPATALVVDAAAIAVLAEEPELIALHRDRAVVMPNPAETAQLIATSQTSVEDDPDGSLDRAVQTVDAVVALRGAETRIGVPQGERYLDRSGHPGLATAGSGDVLAGILGGLMARGADHLTATLWAVHVHGTTGNRLAATRYPLGIVARDLLDAIPESLAILSQ
jgi:hydroxyethylthiazole kinase-like uncharacterized protein yjeF